MKIAVTNTVMSNGGDAAIFFAIRDALSASGIANPEDVIALDSDARSVRSLYPNVRVEQQLTVARRRANRTYNRVCQMLTMALASATKSALVRHILTLPLLRAAPLARSLRAVNEADLIISSGGTYLVDHYDFSPRALELEIANSLNKPLVLWTQSMGPFESKLAEISIRRILSVSDQVYVRDGRSLSSLERVREREAIPARMADSVVPDSVFGLELLPRQTSALDSSPSALISVRMWGSGVDTPNLSYENYSTMLTSGADHLLSKSWRVTAVSTCQGVPNYAHDDSVAASHIFRNTKVSIDSTFHSPYDLLDLQCQADLVIATRMHFAILSLLSKTPVVAIAYEFKTLELFRSLGLEDFVLPIEHSSPEWLIERLELLENDPSSAVLSDSALGELKEAARWPATQLGSLLSARARPRD